MTLRIEQTPPRPQRPRPIVLIGAGGIVHDAHLPAYRKAGFPVHGITDLQREKAETLARAFAIPNIYATTEEAVQNAPPEAVYDIAVPASALLSVLEKLPPGAAALMQKPMGENLEQARAIRALCRERKLTAAVNFQLRFAPYILAARSLIAQGVVGELHDMEVRVTVDTPWHLWAFFATLPRVEILYHSVHYIDLLRSFLGEPRGVYAKTLRHPNQAGLANTRSAILLDYGDAVRATITTNHGHRFGQRHQESYVKWEGTRGAIKATLGLLMNYPQGLPDALEYSTEENGALTEWRSVPLEGSWFPDAFIGTMGSLLRFAEGSSDTLPTAFEDAYRTMTVVEAAYRSSVEGATPIAV
ncbi:MAG TPA: Gfo/Idh/MocA family oxidoreductase [Chthonomonadaceae bacterium]|nr:Gfo/Idh/MocA family oxidoreductase [Chthonomonadaceae bacterium]